MFMRHALKDRTTHATIPRFFESSTLQPIHLLLAALTPVQALPRPTEDLVSAAHAQIAATLACDPAISGLPTRTKRIGVSLQDYRFHVVVQNALRHAAEHRKGALVAAISVFTFMLPTNST